MRIRSGGDRCHHGRDPCTHAIYACVCVCVYACMCVCVCVCAACVCTYASLHTYVPVCDLSNLCIHVCLPTYVSVSVCVCVYEAGYGLQVKVYREEVGSVEGVKRRRDVSNRCGMDEYIPPTELTDMEWIDCLIYSSLNSCPQFVCMGLWVTERSVLT